ncbi:DUF5959 family protein [Streptomyces sp. NPDC048442]|uniref:DUF5959 family protein n=1 Tax=Streptomyces sp. NPDC048442 TaxID=3154823 RepID=UPI0034263FDE
MTADSMELFRLEGEENSVSLRIDRVKKIAQVGAPDYSLIGEIILITPFVRGSISIVLFTEHVEAWQAALDSLDAGQHVEWHDDGPFPWVYIERDVPEDRAHITIKDLSMSLTTVTVTVSMDESWFDGAYEKLDRVLQSFPHSSGSA